MIHDGCGRQFPMRVKIDGLFYDFCSARHEKGVSYYKYSHDEKEVMFILPHYLLTKIRIKADEIQYKQGKINPAIWAFNMLMDELKERMEIAY